MNENVVPIGTGGRPGRGGGRTTPSSAARRLAGGTASQRPKPVATADAPTADEAPAEAPTANAPTADAPTADEASADEARQRRTPRTPSGLGDLAAVALAGARSSFDDAWEAKAAEMLALVRRRISGDYAIDEFGLDPQIHELVLATMRPLAHGWFRMEVRGAENIPAEGGALVVANHSGTIPLDAGMTGLALHDHAGRDLRLLGADLVFALPFVGEMARKTGATLACTEDAERLLAGGHIAGVWPEGFKGIGKPYTERYKLQRFGRGGFVAAAMRAGVPIVPVSIVGAEEIYPLIGNVPSLARLLGVPYIPITPFFPWLGPLGMVPLPSKWIIEFGEPIRTDAYDTDAADDPMLVFNLTDQVRETIQQTLYSLLVDRGHPFV